MSFGSSRWTRSSWRDHGDVSTRIRYQLLADLDTDRVNAFLSNARAAVPTLRRFDDMKVLLKMGVLAKDGVATVAGLILSANTRSSTYPQSDQGGDRGAAGGAFDHHRIDGDRHDLRPVLPPDTRNALALGASMPPPPVNWRAERSRQPRIAIVLDIAG